MNILVLTPEAYDGSTWYRIHSFARTAQKKENVHVEFLDFDISTIDLAKTLSKADVFLCRPNEGLLQLFDEFHIEKLNKPFIVDIDDRIGDPNPLSDAYAWMGTKDVKLDSDTWLWKTGQHGFDRRANKERVEKIERLLSLSTAVTTTTFMLKNYVSQFNKNVVVLPNAIDPALFPPIELKKPKNEVRIVWSGGSSHYEDLASITPALANLMNKYPQVHYYHLGQVFTGIIKQLPQDRVHIYGWTRPEAHGYRLATLGADIGLAPLTDHDFNLYKSSIKYYEYSALRIATLARNISPYTDDIQNGKSGLLYDNNFEEQLEKLITDPLLRISMADQAYRYVTTHRNINDITEDWILFMNELIKLYK